MNKELMIGISVALDRAFGGRYEIYTEENKQDLKMPCFFISLVQPTKTDFPSNRYYMDNLFCIQYIPESETGSNGECVSIGEQMLWVLEEVTPDGEDLPVRGSNMHYEIIDGVLNFFVNYNYFVRKVVDTAPTMETMATRSHVKG